MSLHYIEFVSVQRHILQVEADDEADCLEKARELARSDYCDGLVIHDAENPVLLHDPYNSFSFGEAEDGESVWFEKAFGDDKEWMRDTAARLTFLADRAKETANVDPA